MSPRNGVRPTSRSSRHGHLWGRAMARGCGEPLNPCRAASLLAWGLVSASDKPLIKVAIEVSQHEMKPCPMNLNFSFWPSVNFPFSQGWAILLLQKNHCKTFIGWPFILFYVYSSLGENIFHKKAEYWLQMRTESDWQAVCSWFRSKIRAGSV